MTTVTKVVSTPKAPGAIGPYSQARIVNNMVYTSGQLGMDPQTMDFVSDDVQQQTKKALENLGAILEAAGSSFDKVVKTLIFVADINDFAKVNEVYASFFEEPFPARSCVEAANLPKLARVEIEAIAIVGEVSQ